MIYDIDSFHDFRVVGGKEPTDEYFTLGIETAAGPRVVQLKKLPFQRQQTYSCPPYLSCKVKYIDVSGLPVVAHNIISYVNTLYEQTYALGDSFECTVVTVPSDPAGEPYSICDRYGIFYRLNDPEGLLAKGQKVRMRFNKLTPRFFELSRVDEGARLFYYSPEQILDDAVEEVRLRRLMHVFFERLPGMDAARIEAKGHNPLWVLTACRTVLRDMSEWMLQGSVVRHHRLYSALLRSLRNILLYLLEGSGFLNAAPPEQRRAMQQQLTDMVDTLEPYGLTLDIIGHKGEDSFVEGLLDKLQKSGYLYHPARRFAVLMLIFRLNPDKVGTYLNRIFDSIFGRDLDNWKREPFRSAFVEQFQIYVRQARSDIDSLPVAESREQKARVETVITAIALQMLLSDGSDTDLSQTEPLFYRYVALLRPLNAEALLSKAYVSLMGGDVSTRLTYSQLKEPMMMMTQATVVPPDNLFSRINSTHTFSGGGIDVEISRRGMTIRPTGRRDITERAIPDGLMPWLNPQVMVNGVRSLSGNRLRKINEHKTWWSAIDKALADQQFRSDEKKVRATAEPDDRVYIVIDSTEGYDGDTPVFGCHIEDGEYNDGRGLIRCDSIVGYKLRQPPRRAFTASSGGVRGFLATVVGKDEEGDYLFSLADSVDSYIDEVFNYDDEYKAVVTGINGNDYSVICDLGVGLFLERKPGEEHSVGDIVRFRLSQKGKQGKLRGYITATCDAEADGFDKNDAFLTLMEAIGEEDDNTGEEGMRDPDEILGTDKMRELIEIIRFKAVGETDLIMAYDYINLARILAKALGDTAMTTHLETHANLLTMHQYFAVNSQIDTDSLEEVRPVAEADSFLSLIYNRLRLVSWLGRPDKNDELYQTTVNPSGELEGSIARMVLAYNMLNNDEASETSIAGNIKQQIMEKLNVNAETRRSKYYGSESKYLEFKTSIVYPATAPGDDIREAPQEQQFHIMSRIAGLLNANGGRLYLGVNNDGYEVGLHDDFHYFERHKAVVKGYQFKVSNLDSLTVFLEELINQTFGAKTSRKITVSVDEEAEKGVILFDVEQSLEPVFIDGRLFVRQSGQATREYRGEAIAEFVREREDLLAERQHALALHKKEQQQEATETIAVPVTTKRKALADTENSQSEKADTPRKVTVETSHWRPNVLHDYEPGYAELFGYIYITAGGTIVFSRRDINLDSKDSTLLSLAVTHEDAAGGFLVLGYEEERVLKVPLREIFEQTGSSPMRYNTDNRLMFAAIAGRNDGLMCVGADSGASLSQRLTPLASLPSSHLNSTPRRIHSAPNNHTVAYEIADESTIDSFADSMADKLGSKRFGFTMRVKEGTPNAEYKLNELHMRCAATAQ